MADVRHVNPAGRDIRRDKNSDLSPLKSVESTEALRQSAVSVNDGNAMAGLLKRLTESINPTLRPREDENGPTLHPQQRH
jgi:hypothetical protein